MFSSLQPTKKYILITFLISCILLEVFTLIIYNQSKIAKDSNDWVIHSYQVLRLGRASLVNAIDLANSEQNYMLTGYGSFLKSYDDNLAELNGNLAKLTQTVTDNPEQEENVTFLRDKIEQLKKISASYIGALQKGHISVYSIRSSEVAIKQAIAEVRTAFDTFSQNEDKLLNERIRYASGGEKNYFWTLFMGAFLGLGALILANLVIFSLISKNTRSEEKLRKSEELFASIVDGINDGIFDYNIVENTVSYSPSFKIILGYSPDEMSANHDHFIDMIHPDDLAQAVETVRQYTEREVDTYYNVFRLRHKLGHWVWVMSRGVGIWDEKGKIQRLIGTHVDISVQKQREEELNFFIQENELQRRELALEKERAEAANQAKSDFLATMSHEIRTPLNAVVGLGRLLMDMPMDKKHHEMVEMIHVNADLLLRLVNDLLDLSRIESGQIELEERTFTFPSTFNALQSMFERQASEKNIALNFDNQAGDYTYVADSTRVQQILVNLIGNALKFTSKGSISVVSTAEIQDDKTALVRVSVTDTGVGIAADKLAAVFEKFVQADQTISRRFGGTGLGLTISKSLAALMNGDITASTTLGEGSTFTLILPLKITDQKKKTAALPLSEAAQATIASSTILVVEDYAPNVMVATMMLDYLGYKADVARSGAEAIQKIKDAKTPYAAILMDVQMQDMDGFETTRRVRELEKEKNMRHYIIGVTAHALASDRDHCLDAGMDDYMSKPINPDLLSQKLGKLSQAA